MMMMMTSRASVNGRDVVTMRIEMIAGAYVVDEFVSKFELCLLGGRRMVGKGDVCVGEKFANDDGRRRVGRFFVRF